VKLSARLSKPATADTPKNEETMKEKRTKETPKKGTPKKESTPITNRRETRSNSSLEKK
jgi:hypothetical protein